jgi:quinol monooxygenase YgiN
MIHVVASIELREGTREHFIPEFTRLVPLVRAEEGCIEYGGAFDIESGLGVQVPMRENIFSVVEKWESLEALRAHLAIAHMKEYQERVKPYVLGTTLQVLQPI